MTWRYVKELKSENLISDYERLKQCTFDDSFRKCVLANNGGRPEKSTFDTDKVKGRSFKTLLSFEKEDHETVWKALALEKEKLGKKYAPFGIDNFGNLVCFDTENGKVVFIDHENMSVETIADNFEAFINGLY